MTSQAALAALAGHQVCDAWVIFSTEEAKTDSYELTIVPSRAESTKSLWGQLLKDLFPVN